MPCLLSQEKRPLFLVLALIFAGVFFSTFTQEYGLRADPKPLTESPREFPVVVIDSSGQATIKNLGEKITGSPWLDKEKLDIYREQLGVGLEILDLRLSVPEESIFLESVRGIEVSYCQYLVQQIPDERPGGGTRSRIIPQRLSILRQADWVDIFWMSVWAGLWVSLGAAAVLALGAHLVANKQTGPKRPTGRAKARPRP